MSFDLPAISSKTVSKFTRKTYKTHLNKIAEGGYTTIADLQNNPQGVINRINEIMPEDEPKVKKRVFYSSVFYALADTDFLKTPNPYYRAFQPLKDPIPE